MLEPVLLYGSYTPVREISRNRRSGVMEGVCKGIDENIPQLKEWRIVGLPKRIDMRECMGNHSVDRPR